MRKDKNESESIKSLPITSPHKIGLKQGLKYWPSRIRLGQAHFETDIRVWLKYGLDWFERRNSLELEPWGESIVDGFIPIHPVVEKEKKGLKEKKRVRRMKKWVLGNEVMGLPKRLFGYCRWFYSHSPNCRERKRKWVWKRRRGRGGWRNGFT